MTLGVWNAYEEVILDRITAEAVMRERVLNMVIVESFFRTAGSR